MKILNLAVTLASSIMLVPAASAAPLPGPIPNSSTSLETLFIYNTNPAKECYNSAEVGADLEFGLEHCDLAVRDPLMQFRAQTLVNRGIIRFDLGDNGGALEDFSIAITYNPTLGDAYLNQALVLVASKHPDDAMDAINKGIAMGASNLQLAYYTRGEIEDDAGRYAMAYRDYKQALVIKPDFQPALRQLERFKLVPKDTNTQ